MHKVRATSFGRLDTLDSCVGVYVKLASGHNVVDILGSLLNIALDIHGKTRCFRDGETEVKCNDTGDAAQADENTPTVIDVLKVIDRVVDDVILEGVHHTERN